MSTRTLYGALTPCTVFQHSTTRSLRQISLAAAIGRGIRQADNRSSRLGSSVRSNKDGSKVESYGPLSRTDIEKRWTTPDKSGQGSRRVQRSHYRREDISHDAPHGKPYTTAGSEFLYGTYAVKAALEADRRKLHKIYIWKGEHTVGHEVDPSISSLARKKGVPVQLVAGTWDKMLLKMSDQRPHNGVVLETSPIPKLPVVALDTLSSHGEDLYVRSAPQSLEDEAINKIYKRSKGRAMIPRSGNRARYPLLLWLDRITDTGNLGAIIRTAYFMGVDAIVIPEHGTAPFSPVTVKASAGAAELLPILVVKHEGSFVRLSQESGWKFIAAVAPDSTSTWKKLSQQGSFVAETALDVSPCVLMVGNEGEGLRSNMQKAADNFVSIRGVRGPADGVESLNVSVAAALLVARMLSKSSAAGRNHAASSATSTPAASSSTKSLPISDHKHDDQDSPLF